MRVRGFFVLAVATMGSLAMLASSMIAFGQYQQYRSASVAIGLVDTLRHSTQFVERMSQERGRHSQIVVVPLNRNMEHKKRLDEGIRATDEIIAAIRASSRHLNAVDAAIAESRLVQIETSLKRLREDSASEYTKPEAERTKDVGRRILEQAVVAVAPANILISELQIRLQAEQPQVAAITRIKQTSNKLRDVSGRRSTHISQYVGSGKAFTPDAAREVRELTGQVAAHWQSLNEAVNEIGTTPELARAMTETRKMFFGKGEQRYQEMMQAGTEGRAPNIDPTVWWNESQVYLKTTLSTRDAATTDAMELATASKTQAWLHVVMALVGMLVTIGIVTVLGLLFSRRVVDPIIGLSSAIDAVAAGNLETEVPHADRHDEIGVIAKALDQLRAGAKEAKAFEARAALERETATRDIRRELAAGFQSEVESAVVALIATTETIRSQSQKSVTLTDEMRARSASASQDVRQLAERVTNVASAADELAAAIAEVSRQTSDASATAQMAARETVNASSRIENLGIISGRIDEIVGLIKSIADQTNLLALNATIEAARAGEAGRGFAVVASEVKGLAQQTSHATADIGRQISEMREAIALSVDSIRRVSEQVPAIEHNSSAISAAMEQQRVTTAMISQEVSDASLMTNAIDDMTSSVLASAQTAADAARIVHDAMAELDQRSESMSSRTREFVDKIVA